MQTLRFIQRAYRVRTLGLGMGFFSVATVFHQNGAHPLIWALLIFHGYGWAHLAYLLARLSPDPKHAELRNLIIDSAMIGVWIAWMAFNLLPSLLLTSMLAMGAIMVGGWSALARAFAAQAAACLVTAALFEFPFAPSPSVLTILGCAPLLMIYPLAIAIQSFTRSHKDSRQKPGLDTLNHLDALTDLLNRRHFEQVVAAALSDHSRNGSPAVLLLVDIDKFKQINDRYGHAVGDEVLQHVASVLRKCTRNHDTPGRYGGDEFGLVLTQVDLTHALHVAERIRAAVSIARFKHSPQLHCTVSIGVAEVSRDIDTLQAWFQRADSALYLSKAAGRNRISTPPI